MHGELQGVVEVFVRIVFRGVWRQIESFDLRFVALQPSLHQLAVMHAQVVHDEEDFPLRCADQTPHKLNESPLIHTLPVYHKSYAAGPWERIPALRPPGCQLPSRQPRKFQHFLGPHAFLSPETPHFSTLRHAWDLAFGRASPDADRSTPSVSCTPILYVRLHPYGSVFGCIPSFVPASTVSPGSRNPPASFPPRSRGSLLAPMTPAAYAYPVSSHIFSAQMSFLPLADTQSIFR